VPGREVGERVRVRGLLATVVGVGDSWFAVLFDTQAKKRRPALAWPIFYWGRDAESTPVEKLNVIEQLAGLTPRLQARAEEAKVYVSKIVAAREDSERRVRNILDSM